MASQPLIIDEIVEKLVGYAERIDTPFGEMCSLSCDFQSNQRLYKPIEESVQKLRSHLMQRQQKFTFDGQFTQNMHVYSTNAILEFFGLNSKSHQIEECGSNEISPYTYLGKILQVNYPNRKFEQGEEAGNAVSTNSLSDNANRKVPQVYVTTSESYYNILPWTFYGCKLHSIEVNKQSEINATSLIDKLQKSSDNDLHIVSISGVSNITGQKMGNLENIIKSVLGLRQEMQSRNKNIRIYLCLNITQIACREKLNAKESIYKDVDFFILHATKLFGAGFESTNILISKKESAFNILSLQKPVQDTNNNILDSLIDNNDPTKLYRVALALQLLESVQFEKIRELEKRNVDLFLKEITDTNKDLRKISVLRSINIWGATTNQAQFSYGNLSANIYVPGSEIFDNENKSYLHPDLVCQILHDLFGILATSKRNVNLTDDVTMLNIPKNIYSKLDSIGSSESMLGCIQIDISFLHREEEVKYIAQALRLIGEKGDELQRYYDKKTFLMNQFQYENYDLHLNNMIKVNDTREEMVKKRNQKYDSQMQLAKTVFKNYTRYFSLHDGYTKEKTEQIKKKEIPFCMPPILSQKSYSKLPDDMNDETVLNLQKTAIEKASEYVKAELIKIEEERLRKSKIVSQGTIVLRPPTPQSPEKVKVVEPKESTLSKEELERQFQELIDKKMNEKSKKEKEEMDSILLAMRQEMQQKIEQSSVYKEQFVFEDLQPSVMFKNVLDHREKRYRNLRLIFNNYAKLNLDLADKDPKQKKSRFDIINDNNKNNDKLVAYTMNVQQYLMFCQQFKILNEQIDTNVVAQVYSKSLNKVQHGIPQEMHFTQFVASLEKIALILYFNNQLLITSFDKTEALYQYLQIDDVHQLKLKMVQPQTIQQFPSTSSFNFENTQQNKISYSSNIQDIKSSQRNRKTPSPGSPKLHQLDYDSIIIDQIPPQNKHINTNKPQNYLVNQQRKGIFQNQNKDTNLNWNEINNIMVNPQQLFKNESNFLYHDYTNGTLGKQQSSFSKINSSQISGLSRNGGTSQSVAYLSPNMNNINTINNNYNMGSNAAYKYPSQSPIKTNSDIPKSNYSHNFSQQMYGGVSSSPDSRKNNLMDRIKQIEDSEIKKQKDLLTFLQSNMNHNRYKTKIKK